MSDMEIIVAQLFKNSGSQASQNVEECVQILSLDLRWFSPKMAEDVLKAARAMKLILIDNGVVSPNIDVNKIDVPAGFKPKYESFVEKTVLEKTLDMIVASGMDKREAVAKINEKNERYGLVSIDACALALAKECSIDVDDLIDEAYSDLLKHAAS